MLLTRFLSYFNRVVNDNAEETEIEFDIDGEVVPIKSLAFDVESNKWKISLKGK